MDDDALYSTDDGQQSDGGGGGLRRQLESALGKLKTLEESLPQQLTEAEQRGRTQAQRRFEVLEIVGKDRAALADSFIRDNPDGDITKDLIVDYARPFGVTLDEQAAVTQEPVVPPEVVATAASFHAATAAVGQTSSISVDEYKEKLKDPSTRAEAQQALREGRVVFHNKAAYNAGGIAQ